MELETQQQYTRINEVLESNTYKISNPEKEFAQTALLPYEDSKGTRLSGLIRWQEYKVKNILKLDILTSPTSSSHLISFWVNLRIKEGISFVTITQDKKEIGSGVLSAGIDPIEYEGWVYLYKYGPKDISFYLTAKRDKLSRLRVSLSRLTSDKGGCLEERQKVRKILIDKRKAEKAERESYASFSPDFGIYSMKAKSIFEDHEKEMVLMTRDFKYTPQDLTDAQKAQLSRMDGSRDRYAMDALPKAVPSPFDETSKAIFRRNTEESLAFRKRLGQPLKLNEVLVMEEEEEIEDLDE